MARPRSFDEPVVMRAARETFHSHGYTATSVEDLTASTGLNRSSIYAAFGDKHGLFLASFAQYVSEEGAVLEQELTGDEAGALERLRGHFALKTDDPTGSLRGCLLAKATAELGGDDLEVARMAADFYVLYETALTTCVRQAQAVGDLRSDIAAQDAGVMLLAALRGIEALGRAGQPRSVLETVGRTALASLAAPAADTQRPTAARKDPQ